MIDKIENQIIKLSDKSITVINKETNKTKNVVTGIESFYKMQFNKQMEYNILFRKYGKLPLDRMILHDKQWYFLDDGNYIPQFLSEDDYTIKVQTQAKNKLDNVKNCQKIITIAIEKIIDNRKH